ncbi:MAG: class I SAM-dependent methyltransferase [Candidatus Omnitrophota bacterium]
MNIIADEDFKNCLSWEEKAQKNPLYAVMSSEKFANIGPEKWSPEDLKTFFLKGQYMFDVFFKPVIVRAKFEKERAFIVEYGSGMGRILKAVNAAGYRCAGIDISPTMLAHSQRLVPEVNDLYCLDDQGNCGIETHSADFVYSYAVIQHIKELRLVQQALSEMCRIMKPDGYLKFQYRTITNQIPFKRIKTAGEKLFNFETKSLLVKSANFESLEHNNWFGVPLSFDFIERVLNNARVEVIGIEQDVGKKGNMIWLLGKKLQA